MNKRHFYLATVTTSAVLSLSAMPGALTPAAADDVPWDTQPYYTVQRSAWGGSAIADDGWQLDGSSFSAGNPALPTGSRRAEYNPAQGRNLQILDESGKLLYDVDNQGYSVRLAGVSYPGDPNANKLIAITTRRHCTPDYSTPLIASGITGSNEPTAKCSGLTRYSTARITSVSSKYVYGGFNLVTRGNLPTTTLAGTRFSGWLNNNNPELNPFGDGIKPTYCSAGLPQTDLSEFDAFEWYGKTKNLTQGTHVSCDYPAVGGTRRAGKTAVSSASGWKYASFDFNGGRTRFFMNLDYDNPTLAVGPHGNQYGYSDSLWNSAPSAAQWNRAMFSPSQSDDPGATMKWQVIAQGEVFGSASSNTGNMTTVADSATFPTQTMLVDYVKMYSHA